MWGRALKGKAKALSLPISGPSEGARRGQAAPCQGPVAAVTHLLVPFRLQRAARPLCVHTLASPERREAPADCTQLDTARVPAGPGCQQPPQAALRPKGHAVVLPVAPITSLRHSQALGPPGPAGAAPGHQSGSPILQELRFQRAPVSPLLTPPHTSSRHHSHSHGSPYGPGNGADPDRLYLAPAETGRDLPEHGEISVSVKQLLGLCQGTGWEHPERWSLWATPIDAPGVTPGTVAAVCWRAQPRALGTPQELLLCSSDG